MQSLSKYNKGIKYLLCGIDLFSKYACVVPIKDKKGTSIVNASKKLFQMDEENRIKYGLIKVVNLIIFFFFYIKHLHVKHKKYNHQVYI